MHISLAVSCYAHSNHPLNERGNKCSAYCKELHRCNSNNYGIFLSPPQFYELQDGRDHMYYLCCWQGALYDKICE